jgi:hypothetical protein
MNRDFEFRQLLRAYRAGIIGEQAFEGEMAELERSNGASANGGAGTFHALVRRTTPSVKRLSPFSTAPGQVKPTLELLSPNGPKRAKPIASVLA